MCNDFEMILSRFVGIQAERKRWIVINLGPISRIDFERVAGGVTESNNSMAFSQAITRPYINIMKKLESINNTVILKRRKSTSYSSHHPKMLNSLKRWKFRPTVHPQFRIQQEGIIVLFGVTSSYNKEKISS